jgi:hypothetical protein
MEESEKGQVLTVMLDYVRSFGSGGERECLHLLQQVVVLSEFLAQKGMEKSDMDLLKKNKRDVFMAGQPIRWKEGGLAELYIGDLIVRVGDVGGPVRIQLTERGKWLLQIYQGVPSTEAIPTSVWADIPLQSRAREWIARGIHPIGHHRALIGLNFCGECQHFTASSNWCTNGETTCSMYRSCSMFVPRK